MQSRELTRIERDIVLQYLRDDNVPLTVSLLQKPQQVESELVKSKIEENDEQKIPIASVFPVAIPSDQIKVLDQGIILLKNNPRTVQPFSGKDVRVQFYFNHLGLYFDSSMKASSQGLALTVPANIYRLPEKQNSSSNDFEAAISYSDSQNNLIKIELDSDSTYRCFSAPKWREIQLDKQKEAKELLEFFVNQIKTGKTNGAGNGVQLISIVRFLTENVIDENVRQNVHSPKIIYFDAARIVLGLEDYQNIFLLEESYDLSLSFKLPQDSRFKRNINLSCKVEAEYFDEKHKDKKCVSLCFENLKEEDYRFLSER